MRSYELLSFEIFIGISPTWKKEIIPFLYQLNTNLPFLLSYIIYMLTCTGISIFRYTLLRDPHDTK